MPNNTINNSPFAPTELSSSARFVRTDRAPDAQGFAQIMQAFKVENDAKPEQSEPTNAETTDESAETSSETQSGVDADQKDGETTSDADTGSAEHDGDAGTPDQNTQNVNSDQPTTDTKAAKTDPQTDTQPVGNAQGNIDKPIPVDGKVDQSSDTQPVNPNKSPVQLPPEAQLPTNQPAAPQEIEPTQANEAAFRLLENQSEQAKLTIKGVARSLTHAANANLTTIAVNTRLGQDQSAQPQVQSDQPVPEQTKPASTQQTEPIPTPKAVPEQSDVRIEPRASTPIAPNQAQQHQAVPVEAKIDQTSTDVQYARSQRADAAGIASQTQPSVASIAPDQTTKLQSEAQLAGVARAKAEQIVRGVSSTDAGNNMTDQRQDTNTGSLVERLNKSELHSETRKASVLAQVQRGLASLLRSGKNEMTLKLTPGHLGEIKIRIKTDGDRLKIQFVTDSDEATEHLNDSLKDLRVNLRSRGINLEDVRVEQAPSNDKPNDTPGADAQGEFDSSTADHQGNHNNHRSAQHQSETEPGIEPGDGPQQGPSESIWTDLGLDAIA